MSYILDVEYDYSISEKHCEVQNTGKLVFSIVFFGGQDNDYSQADSVKIDYIMKRVKAFVL